MRITIDLDDDLAIVAKEMARRRETTIGRIVSDMFRQTLNQTSPLRIRNGVPLFTPKKRTRRMTMALVNRLRD